MDVVLLGGTGFVGVHLVSELLAAGHRVRLLCRGPAPVPSGGRLQCQRVAFDEPGALRAALAGAAALVSLAGILHQRRRGDFEAVHHRLPLSAVRLALAAGVQRVVHVSALGAGIEAPSEYLRSKGRAEAALASACAGHPLTLVQPSVIFGPGDELINRFDALLRFAPVLPMARGGTLFQPVAVEDVVAATVAALGEATPGARRLALVGPERMTLVELVQSVARVRARRRWVFALPEPLGWLQAAALGLLPSPPMTLDNYRSLARANIADAPPQPRALGPAMEAYLGWGDRRAQRARLWQRAAAMA